MKKQSKTTTTTKTLLSKSLSTSFLSNYVYTEADLGEGILHAGVDESYFSTTKNSSNYCSTMYYAGKQNENMLVPNVGEDLSYAYYAKR